MNNDFPTVNMQAPKYLNLGCGTRHHPDWINIDIASRGPGIIQHDLSQGIPLPDSSCDVVYHAAVLEHMHRSGAEAFMAECFRVTKPGGIVRIAVPDLEKICQLYLFKMNAALNGDELAASDYDWLMLELFDQSVREKSGGEMLNYLQQNPLPNETFVYERIGEEGRQLVKNLQKKESHGRLNFPSFSKLIRGLRVLSRVVSYRLPKLLICSSDRRALEIGRFRLSGEVHRWGYDRYSLARLLRLTGFQDPQLRDAKTSKIINWTRFNLDTLPDGTIIKPDLFFMEAIKP